MANAYRYPKTSMGIILGTGTNAGKVWGNNKKKISGLPTNTHTPPIQFIYIYI